VIVELLVLIWLIGQSDVAGAESFDFLDQSANCWPLVPGQISMLA
jgi:hypothetical protein